MNQIRTLRADEIECRIGTFKEEKGLSLLLYKDARCDMAILDETFGAMNWQRHHSRDNANCIVSIWDDEKKQWIDKEDTGVESNTEAAKGLASDSFKRACVNVGIGRELYTAPFIWISADKFRDKYDKFAVVSIGYDEKREINQLTIKNVNANAIVFDYPTKNNTSASEKPTTTQNNAPVRKITPPGAPPKNEMPELMTNCAECKGVITPWIKDGVTKMTQRQIAETSVNEYGVPLCLNCIKKRQK